LRFTPPEGGSTLILPLRFAEGEEIKRRGRKLKGGGGN